MWLFTTSGFLSVVAHRDNRELLMVRARVKDDLVEIRQNLIRDMSEPFSIPGSDYPWRATVSREAFAKGVATMVQDIDYDNFKNRIAEVQGWDREGVYARVWGVLRELEELGEE